MTQRDADKTPRSTESPEGANSATANQTTNQTSSPTPRRRRAPSRSSAGKQTQSTQAAPAAPSAAPVSEPIAQPTTQQPQATQSQTTQHHEGPAALAGEHPQTAAPAAEAAAKPARAHRSRGGRGRRTGTVTIVVPPAPEAATQEASAVAEEVEAQPATTAVPDAGLTGTAEPQVVPASDVRAEEQAAATPATFESPAVEAELRAATAEPEWSPLALTATPEVTAWTAPVAEPAQATPPRSRYRFERRSPVSAVQAPSGRRPEHLSGRLAMPLPGAAGTGLPSVAEEAAVEQQSAETAPALAEAEPQPVAPQAVSPEVHVTAPTAPGTTPIETTESVTALTSQVHAEEAGEGHEEHEGTARRRRRRRRTPTAPEGANGAEPESAPQAAAELVEAPHEGGNGFEASYPGAALETSYLPYTPEAPITARRAAEHQPTTYPPYMPGREAPWSITQAQQQIRQAGSPFGAPEPSFAEGFGPQPRGAAQPFRESLARTTRTEREAPPISTNQLAQMIGTAFQQQTDRLIAELRRQVMTPPTITVAMPPMQSTERVGVFVDVANLIYSARNMHIAIDFGRLLDFLRGDRRLIRAHAYAPTSPEPHAEQAFLSVVKGVGYRITTKNYKTFSSGAKKADLDLDMCMDIVRLVEAGAIDTVVLVSGDSDFLPVLEWASDKGVRIEVAAFEDAASAVLRQSCDLFVNLSLVPDIRA